MGANMAKMARISRFWRQKRGSTAVEFALVATPLIGLALACLETAIMMMTSSVLQNGITAAAREIRTGALQSATTGSCPAGGVSAGVFSALAAAVAANALGISIPNLTYDVRSFSSFATAQPPALAFDASGKPTNNCFDTGGANAIVAVRIAYNYNFIIPGLGTFLGGGATSPSVPFVYTVIIQNEPFS